MLERQQDGVRSAKIRIVTRIAHLSGKSITLILKSGSNQSGFGYDLTAENSCAWSQFQWIIQPRLATWYRERKMMWSSTGIFIDIWLDERSLSVCFGSEYYSSKTCNSAVSTLFMAITLYITRHAKAEDRAMFMADHDRDLLPDGIIAAARMGRYLREQAILPDSIISSTANRARDTAKVMAEQLGFSVEQIQFRENLFDGGMQAYLAAVNAIPDTVQSAMIVGHNPDVSYFAEFLTHQAVGSMSKGAVVGVTFENLTWGEVSGRTGSLSFQMAPRELPASQQ
jgi:phosphohistidine phosphatase